MKTYFYRIIIFLFLLILGEGVLGYWFSKDNFGIYMRKERNKNWETISNFNNQQYKFFYKRNFYGFRGDEFNPNDVKIVFEGGSTGNERFTPEEYTIVGLLNQKFKSDQIDLKIYNASTDGKSLRGMIYDFNHWFPKINNFKPEYIIFYLGLNDRALSDQVNERMFDLHIQEKRIDRIKDYIKNNSFIYERYKTIANKYFPKQTSGYFVDNDELYKDFKYFGYKQAKELNKDISNEDRILIKQLEKRLLVLKKILIKNKITPIFITQITFNGIKDQKLFWINEKLKDFSKNNGFQLIKLDEIINMSLYDFYDEMHTTPKGSKKIADAIYPYLKKMLLN